MNFDHQSAADFFDEIGNQYDQAIYRCVPRYDEMLDQMLKYVELSRPQKILELGCGTGNLTTRLIDRYPDAIIHAVDASGEMIKILQNRIGEEVDAGPNHDQPENLVLIEKTFQELSFPAEEFDLVVSSISIHHLDDSEKLELFSGIRKWISSKGIFTFCDQFSGETDELYSRHMAHWRKASMEMGATKKEWNDWMEHQEAHDFHSSLLTHFNLLQKAGFHTIDCTRRYFLWTTMIAHH